MRIAPGLGRGFCPTSPAGITLNTYLPTQHRQPSDDSNPDRSCFVCRAAISSARSAVPGERTKLTETAQAVPRAQCRISKTNTAHDDAEASEGCTAQYVASHNLVVGSTVSDEILVDSLLSLGIRRISFCSPARLGSEVGASVKPHVAVLRFAADRRLVRADSFACI